MHGEPLHKKIREAAGAGFGGIWVRSTEQEDAIKQVAEACRHHGWRMITWDAENGTQEPTEDGMQPIQGIDTGGGNAPTSPLLQRQAAADPANALKILRSMRPNLNEVPDDGQIKRVLLVMRQPHHFMFNSQGTVTNPILVQTMQHVVEQGEDDAIHVVVLASDNAFLPPELKNHFFMLDHDMPGPDELWELFTNIAGPDELPEEGSRESELLLDAAAGLTKMEAGGAIGLALTRLKRGEKLDSTSLLELKANTLRKSGLMSMYQGDASFDSLGGLNHAKDFCLRLLNSPNRSRHVQSKGVGLVGIPGTGKSEFAKALGNEMGLPTIILDFGALMGGIVGQTESQARSAFKTIDAMAPCLVFVDEVEKGLAGSGGSGNNDSGVAKRLLGTTLTWLNDHKTEVFFIFTANDINSLTSHAPEFTRAERFDAMFFMDMPSREQLDVIWNIYIDYFAQHGLKDTSKKNRPNDDGWTGAEIKACCRLATLLDCSLKEAAKQVVPVSATQKERIEELRTWAHGRCLSADFDGVFDKNAKHKLMTADQIQGRPTRKVTRRTDTVKA